MIKLVGTTSPLVHYSWDIKLYIESLPFAGANVLVNHFLHICNGLFPPILSHHLMQVGCRMDHHVACMVGGFEEQAEIITCFQQWLDQFVA